MILNYINNKFDDSLRRTTIFFSLVGMILGIIFSASFDTPIVLIALIFSGVVVSFFCLIEVQSIKSALISSMCVVFFGSTIRVIISEINSHSLIYLLIVIIFTEILFAFDKTKPNEKERESIIWFTTCRKIEAFIESVFIFFGLKSLYYGALSVDYIKIYPVVIDILEIVLLIVVVSSIIYGYIWINSLRYRRQ